MIRFRKVLEKASAARGMGTLRHLRYSAVAIALTGLAWSGYLLVDIQHRNDAAFTRAGNLRHAVTDLRAQVARQQASSPPPAVGGVEEEATAEALVARVGMAARESGMSLAQSRVVVSPVSAQAPAAPGGAAQNPAPAPVDPGGVEFHLTGSYASLQRMLKAFCESRSRFQVVTLDVLRAKVAEKTGSSQLDIRLVCIL